MSRILSPLEPYIIIQDLKSYVIGENFEIHFAYRIMGKIEMNRTWLTNYTINKVFQRLARSMQGFRSLLF